MMETIPSRTGDPEDVVEIDYYQDLTLDEIGEMLNISRSTVKRYLKSARKHLEKLAF